MINLTTKVVCDAGPVIHLDELNCLDLLADSAKAFLPKGEGFKPGEWKNEKDCTNKLMSKSKKGGSVNGSRYNH